jgi:PAS domain S-box-containing protein
MVPMSQAAFHQPMLGETDVKPDRIRLLLLTVLMALVAATVSVVGLLIFHQTNVANHEHRLTDLVSTRAAFIETLLQATSGDLEVTLELLAAVQSHSANLGDTGEFTVGERDENRVRFLVPLRYPVPGDDGSSVAAATLAEPMRRALAGESGHIVGADYRGERVLAAFRPVAGTDWGLVAKIDLAEVRAPIIRAAVFSSVATILVVALAALVFTAVTSPVLARIEESEQRLKTYFDHSLTGMAFTSPEKGWLQANRSVCDMLGYSFEELRELTWADLTHPDDLDADVAQFQRLLAGEVDGYQLEKRFIRQDGRAVPTLLSVKAIRRPDGSVNYLLAQLQDISDRVAQEQALRERVKELRCLFELSKVLDDPELDFDEMLGRVPGLLVNALQYPSAAVAKVVFDGLESTSEDFDLSEKTLRTEITVEGEVRGAIEVAYLESLPGADKGPFLDEERALLTDVATRLGEAAAARASQERFRTLITKIPIPIALVDDEGTMVFFNERFVDTFGYTLADVPDITTWWTSAYPDESYRREVLETWNEAVRVAAETTADIRPIEYRVTCKDGTQRTMSIGGIVLESGFLATLVDLSERVRAEEALAASEKRYRAMFDSAPVSIWDEDWSDVIPMVRQVVAREERDARSILEGNPGFVQEALRAVRIRDVNQATLSMFEADTKDQMLASLETVFATPDTLPGFIDELVALAENQEVFSTEMTLRTVQGRLIHTLLTMSFPPADSGSGDVLVSLMDISDRVAAEAGLRASEERLQRVVRDAPFPIMVHADDGEILMLSRVWNEITGYRAEEIATIGDWTERAYGQRRESVVQVIEKLHSAGQRSHEGEFVVTTRSGEERIWDFSSAPLGPLADGRRAVVSMANDITEREHARRELVAEKNFSEAMLTSLPGVCYLFDESLRFQRWNHNFEAVTGYSAAEIAEITPLALFEGDDQERVAQRIGEVFATGESSVEAGFLAKDGTVTPHLFTGRMVHIGEQNFLVGMGIDITDRKRAEEELSALNADLERRVEERARELKQAHERLRFVVGATPAVIVARRATEDLAPTFVSDNIVKILGHRPDEFTSDPEAWLERVHPDDRDHAVAALRRVLESGDAAFEFRMRTADGTDTWMLADARLVHDADGRAQEIVSAWLDITERKHAEERVNTLNRELEAAVEKLAASNEELESFSYTVSHDLRAPLRAIDGFSRILVDEYGETLEGEARRYLQIVRDNTVTMGQLIDDLLAFSRLSRQEMHSGSVDLAEIVDLAWTELTPDREGRTIDFTVGDLSTVRGDARLFKQVFMNLLGNALKFTRPREVSHITVEMVPMDGGEVCRVRDNGVGFDARYSDKLFGVFQRLHRADEFEGTGVGLATVARIMHRHGGTVWAESEVGKGATFYLRFEGGNHGTHQPG